MHPSTTKISSKEAHYISKPLLANGLKKGDKWYAIDKHWFDKFKRFEMNFVNDGINGYDLNQPQKEEYPPEMDNSCLKSNKNYFALNEI